MSVSVQVQRKCLSEGGGRIRAANDVQATPSLAVVVSNSFLGYSLFAQSTSTTVYGNCIARGLKLGKMKSTSMHM